MAFSGPRGSGVTTGAGGLSDGPPAARNYGPAVCVQCGVNATPSKWMKCYTCTYASVDAYVQARDTALQRKAGKRKQN